MEKDKYEHIGMQHINTRILSEKRNGGETEKILFDRRFDIC